MLPLALAALLFLEHASAVPAPQPASELGVASHVLGLHRVGVRPASSKALQAGLELVKSAPLKSVEDGTAYGVTVNLGGKNFEVLFDTGSSDLWVFKDGVKCYNANGVPEAASKCGFGPEFSGTFGEGQISGENLYAQYGSGAVIGTVGHEKVTVAGVTVNEQEIGLVTQAVWEGDGSLSGTFGFARSALTSAFKGTNPAKDSAANHLVYSSFIDSAITQGKISPIFSVVLERGGGSSQVALGGLPTISFDHSFATVPIQKTEGVFAYYSVPTEGIVVNGKGSSGFSAVVDTGTTLIYLDNDVAAAVNKAFDPPSKMKEGAYVNSCSAKPPSFAVKIGGKTFNIKSSDLLSPVGGGECVSGIQPRGSTPVILGEVFLKNVVAVFDIGKEQMQFAPHVNY